MKTLLCALILSGVLIAQQTSLPAVALSAPAPQSPVVTASPIGTPGGTQYFYAVVAHYPVGAAPSAVVTVNNGPLTINGTNSIVVGWAFLPGATTYDVLRVPTNSFNGVCTCRISLAQTGNTFSDTGGAAQAYTMTAGTNVATAQILLNNRDYSVPQLRTIVNNTDTGPLAPIPGSDTQMFFNDGGILNATSGLTWNKTTNLHTITGDLSASCGGTASTCLFGAAVTNVAPSANDTLYAGDTQTGTSASRGLHGESEFDGTSNNGNTMTGILAGASTGAVSTANLTSGAGGLRNLFTIAHNGTGIVTQASAVRASVSGGTGSGAITEASIFDAVTPAVPAAATWTNFYGLHVRGGAVTGTLTNRYGVRVDTLTGGTTKWAFYSQTDPSFFGGPITTAITASSIVKTDASSVLVAAVSGTDYAPANILGSGTINFAAIADGACLSSTFTLTGAVTGDKLAPAWPSTLEAGLTGSMLVSAADTAQVRLCNLSGAAVDPASQTFGAGVIR